LTDLGLVCYNEPITVTQKEGRMITLTELAATQLQQLLARQDPPDQGVRIFVQAGGCAGLQYGMNYEREAREGDITVEAKGIQLFVDPFSVSYLEGSCIDYQELLMGGGFRVDNPNAVVTCACGLSFRVEGEEESEGTSTE
jgi:iron-sulfur cluster assembly accessory protein